MKKSGRQWSGDDPVGDTRFTERNIAPSILSVILWTTIAVGLSPVRTIPCRAQVHINEVHAVPAAGEPEWIEVVNAGSIDIRMTSWSVCDARTCVGIPDITLSAGRYAVFTRDTVALREARYVDERALLVEVRLPSLNNGVDDVVIRNGDIVVVDSMSYDMQRGVRGRSLERSDSSSWHASRSRDSATCGYLNSIVTLDHDRAIANIGIDGATYAIRVRVANVGRGAMPSTVLRVLGSMSSADGTAAGKSVPELTPGSWIDVSLSYDGVLDTATAGASATIIAWFDDGDDRPDNDTAILPIIVPPRRGSLTITEVMFDPMSWQCDYVELYNGTSDTIDLQGWSLADTRSNGVWDTTDIETSVTLRPGAFAVLAADTSIDAMLGDPDDVIRRGSMRRGWNLNADAGEVSVMTPSGFVVDRIRYDSRWHNPHLPERKGVSLEKPLAELSGMASESWLSSGDPRGGTPARKNSVGLPLPSGGKLVASPSPFSTRAGAPAHPCLLRFDIPAGQAVASLRILTPEGMPVRTLLDAVFVGTMGVVAWDGIDDHGVTVRPGPYVALVEAVDAVSGELSRALCLVVVGE